MCNHYAMVAENSVKYLPPDCFFGIQILQNSISAGAPSWTAGSAYDAPPDPLFGWVGGYPCPNPTLRAKSQIRSAFRWAKTSVWAIANPKRDLNIPIRTERIAQSESTAERFAER